MLLPRLLRERAPDLSIAFFLHVPFPAFELFRILPDAWSRELLRGVLGADVVGFHTHDYARHFLRSADRLLGVESRDGQVRVGGHVTCVDAFPIGIDFDRLDRASTDPEVQAAASALAPAIGDRRIVLSVDRLDYTKGILNRLLAFERLLEQAPDWHGRVTLVAVAVPSRERVDSYRRMRTEIEQTVGRVNGRFGRLD
jgi:trehalose 6-phosphate synthase/phosphatase